MTTAALSRCSPGCLSTLKNELYILCLFRAMPHRVKPAHSERPSGRHCSKAPEGCRLVTSRSELRASLMFFLSTTDLEITSFKIRRLSSQHLCVVSDRDKTNHLWSSILCSVPETIKWSLSCFSCDTYLTVTLLVRVCSYSLRLLKRPGQMAPVLVRQKQRNLLMDYSVENNDAAEFLFSWWVLCIKTSPKCVLRGRGYL